MRVIVERNLEDGVLDMVIVVRLQKAFHLQWVGKLANSGEEKWTHIPRRWFSKLANGFGMFNLNCRSTDVKRVNKINNGVWKSVLCTYLETGKLTTDNETDCENGMAWQTARRQPYNSLCHPSMSHKCDRTFCLFSCFIPDWLLHLPSGWSVDLS